MEQLLCCSALHADILPDRETERERHYSGVRELAEPLSIYLERTRLRLLFCRSTWLSNLAAPNDLVCVGCLFSVGTAGNNKMSWLWLNSFISVPLGPSPSFTFHLLHNLRLIIERSSAAPHQVWHLEIYILWIHNVFWDCVFFDCNTSIMLSDLI